jgi:hydroxymethylbilane synthase
VEFHALGFQSMVPAVGQGAVAIQCRTGDAGRFAAVFDAATSRHVALERAFQSALGGGCHTAFAAYVTDHSLYFFHEKTGLHSQPLGAADFADPAGTAARILRSLGLV